MPLTFSIGLGCPNTSMVPPTFECSRRGWPIVLLGCGTLLPKIKLDLRRLILCLVVVLNLFRIFMNSYAFGSSAFAGKIMSSTNRRWVSVGAPAIKRILLIFPSVSTLFNMWDKMSIEWTSKMIGDHLVSIPYEGIAFDRKVFCWFYTYIAPVTHFITLSTHWGAKSLRDSNTPPWCLGLGIWSIKFVGLDICG